MPRGDGNNQGSEGRRPSGLTDRFDLTLAMILLVSVVGAAQFKILVSEPAEDSALQGVLDPVQAPDLSHLPAIPKPGVPIFDLEASWDRDAGPSALDDFAREPVRVAPSVRLGTPGTEAPESMARGAR